MNLFEAQQRILALNVPVLSSNDIETVEQKRIQHFLDKIPHQKRRVIVKNRLEKLFN